jgi:hypothetical protein
MAHRSDKRAEQITVVRAELIAALNNLDALRAEVERLNAERQGWADTFAQNMKVIGAENARLRMALEGVLAEADRKTDAFDRAHAALE